jgi:undecaprenyl-diphosphatase
MPVASKKSDVSTKSEANTQPEVNAKSVDKRIYHWVTDQWGKSATLDGLFRVVAEWTPMVMLAVIVIAATGYAWDLPYALHHLLWPSVPSLLSPGALPRICAGVSVVSAVLVRALNEPIARVVDRPRPFQESVVLPLVGHEDGGSFPSNHAAGAFALAFGFWPATDYFTTLIALAVLLCVSRVYTGLHYFTDVFAGAINGWIVAMMVTFITFRFV